MRPWCGRSGKRSALKVISHNYLLDVPYPSGLTAYYRVEVDLGEPRLGSDDLDCDCPRMIGLNWVPLPVLPTETGRLPIAPVIYAW